MIDAPKRIWVNPLALNTNSVSDNRSGGWPEFVRADLYEAQAAENIRLRAHAARKQHCAENPEYPMSKAELRKALNEAVTALHAIATSRAALQDTKQGAEQ